MCAVIFNYTSVNRDVLFILVLVMSDSSTSMDYKVQAQMCKCSKCDAIVATA